MVFLNELSQSLHRFTADYMRLNALTETLVGMFMVRHREWAKKPWASQHVLELTVNGDWTLQSTIPNS